MEKETTITIKMSDAVTILRALENASRWEHAQKKAQGYDHGDRVKQYFATHWRVCEKVNKKFTRSGLANGYGQGIFANSILEGDDLGTHSVTDHITPNEK